MSKVKYNIAIDLWRGTLDSRKTGQAKRERLVSRYRKGSGANHQVYPMKMHEGPWAEGATHNRELMKTAQREAHAIERAAMHPELATPEYINLAADVARPEWVAPVDYDYTSSMTAVIRVDLKAQYPDAAKDFELKDDDLIAAFIGDECLGVASPDDGLFYLYIASPTSNSDSGLTGEAGLISLRYYSAHYKNLFVAKDAFPFVNDDQQGTYNAPFVPTLVVVTD